MNSKQYLYIFSVLLCTSGCVSTEEPETSPPLSNISSAELSPLTSEIYQQASSTCRQEIDHLWQQRFSIPKEKQKDFHEMMGRAAKNCNDLIEAFKQLQLTTSHYTEALKKAQLLSSDVLNQSYSSQSIALESAPIEEQNHE
ncbi:MAG: hypothetical protein J0H12_06205 [Candidatus Paracaedimonas acanthamoebae]|uniref:Uncharacterized protein n=1 Tax=Candidatus Paracaedimonas acanthamoebae TaxID=244581 RepID=A0A8J7PJU2_9PROT|nr:hypothetical protein [Candidatus Paracaedimonas acanthamoebae]